MDWLLIKPRDSFSVELGMAKEYKGGCGSMGWKIMARRITRILSNCG
jgi:hypothetical protein